MMMSDAVNQTYPRLWRLVEDCLPSCDPDGYATTQNIMDSVVWPLQEALLDLLVEMLESSLETLDPKDVMRFHRPSYDALFVDR